jgi:hypothetical protein
MRRLWPAFALPVLLAACSREPVPPPGTVPPPPVDVGPSDPGAEGGPVATAPPAAREEKVSDGAFAAALEGVAADLQAAASRGRVETAGFEGGPAGLPPERAVKVAQERAAWSQAWLERIEAAASRVPLTVHPKDVNLVHARHSLQDSIHQLRMVDRPGEGGGFALRRERDERFAAAEASLKQAREYLAAARP